MSLRRALPCALAMTLAMSSIAEAQRRVTPRATARDYRNAPAILKSPVLDTAAPVQVRAIVVPDTVYVGQQTSYQVAAFFARRVRDRVRRPEFFAPEMRGMLAYESPSDLPAYTISSRGKSFEAFVYQRAIFPVTAGRFTIPSARLTYALPLTPSFFSRDESYEARSDSIVVVAIDPPSSGRPPEFQGAVGALTVEAALDSAAARVGDPLLLRVRVAGIANVKLLPRPAIRVPWATLVPADERVTIATDRDTVRGVKEFDWVLTPTRPGVRSLGPIRYWYFDPWTESYRLAETAVDSIVVAPGTLAALDTGTTVVPPLPLRTAYRGPLPPPPHERREFWLLLGLAPIPATLRSLTRRRRALRRPVSSSRDLRTLARTRQAPTAAELRRALVRALAERLHVSAATLASNGALARAARREGVSAPVAERADALLARLDRAAFGGDAEPLPDAAAEAWRLYRAIDREARPHRPLRAGRTGLLIALSLGVLAGGAVALDVDPATRFAQGVGAYRSQDYLGAARDFSAVATAVPRSPDAWMNYGTASWESADTARAVLGWQRALRLEPLAADARHALTRVDLPVDESLGDLPPLPVGALAMVAALCWVVAWMYLAVRIHRPGTATVTLGGLALSLTMAAVAFTAHSVTTGRGLAVLDATGALRALPALAAEYGASARVGEVVRVVERRGDWTRVTLAGAREGWIEHALLVPLVRD